MAPAVTPWIVAAFEDGRAVLPANHAVIRFALEEVGIGFAYEMENGGVSAAGVTYSAKGWYEVN